MAQNQKHDIPALCSLLCPGLGQVVKGDFAKGVAFFVGSFPCFPVLWPWSVVDAYNYNPPEQTAALQAPAATAAAPLPALVVDDPGIGTGAYKVLGLIIFLAGLAYGGAAYAGSLPTLSTWFPWWTGGLPAAFGGTMLFQAFQVDVRNRREREKRKAVRLEREVLQIAQRKGGRITSVDVATQCGMTLDESRELLEKLARAGHVAVTVSAEGVFVYRVIDVSADDAPATESIMKSDILQFPGTAADRRTPDVLPSAAPPPADAAPSPKDPEGPRRAPEQNHA